MALPGFGAESSLRPAHGTHGPGRGGRFRPTEDVVVAQDCGDVYTYCAEVCLGSIAVPALGLLCAQCTGAVAVCLGHPTTAAPSFR